MENTIFSGLKNHVNMSKESPNENSDLSEQQGSGKKTVRFSFVLFEEIVEHSPIQSREVIFDPDVCSEDQELLDSISTVGITTPIIVQELKDQQSGHNPFHLQAPGERKFCLVAGHRRVAAGREAGLPGTEGIILQPGDDPDLITTAENMGRKELTSYEKALALKNLKDRKSLTLREVARSTGYSKSHIHRLYTALESPRLLREEWITGKISASTIVCLKEHWAEFSDQKAGHLRESVQRLTLSMARELADQLSTGTPLETALKAVCSAGNTTPEKAGPDIESPEAAEPKPALTFKDKQALIAAVQDVFYRFSKDRATGLYDLALVNNVKDLDVFWAGALYVARGGDPDFAFQITKRVMSNRIYRGLLNRAVKNHQRAAAIIKSNSSNPTTKKFLKICFPKT